MAAPARAAARPSESERWGAPPPRAQTRTGADSLEAPRTVSTCRAAGAAATGRGAARRRRRGATERLHPPGLTEKWCGADPHLAPRRGAGIGAACLTPRTPRLHGDAPAQPSRLSDGWNDVRSLRSGDGEGEVGGGCRSGEVGGRSTGLQTGQDFWAKPTQVAACLVMNACTISQKKGKR